MVTRRPVYTSKVSALIASVQNKQYYKQIKREAASLIWYKFYFLINWLNLISIIRVTIFHLFFVEFKIL